MTRLSIAFAAVNLLALFAGSGADADVVPIGRKGLHTFVSLDLGAIRDQCFLPILSPTDPDLEKLAEERLGDRSRAAEIKPLVLEKGVEVDPKPSVQYVAGPSPELKLLELPTGEEATPSLLLLPPKKSGGPGYHVFLLSDGAGARARVHRYVDGARTPHFRSNLTLILVPESKVAEVIANAGSKEQDKFNRWGVKGIDYKGHADGTIPGLIASEPLESLGLVDDENPASVVTADYLVTGIADGMVHIEKTVRYFDKGGKALSLGGASRSERWPLALSAFAIVGVLLLAATRRRAPSA